MKRIYLTVFMMVVIALETSLTVWAGWEEGTGENAGKWRYTFDDGSTPHNDGCYIKDRDGSGRTSIYYFDEAGWLRTSETFLTNSSVQKTVNEYGQVLDGNGQVLRPFEVNTYSSNEHLQNLDRWVIKNGEFHYCFSDGSYAIGQVWLDSYMKNESTLYSFDQNGVLITDRNRQRVSTQTVSTDDSILRQEGFTQGFSNTALYMLTHTLDEVNAKYEIEKAMGSESHSSDGGIKNTYYIKYKGIPLIASFEGSNENVYTCRNLDDISEDRNALICDIPNPYSYEAVTNLFIGSDPYYDWIAIGGAAISHSFNSDPKTFLYVGYEPDYGSPDKKLDISSWAAWSVVTATQD